MGFPGGAVVENLPANAGDTGSSPGLGRSHMPRSNWAREPQLLSLHCLGKAEDILSALSTFAIAAATCTGEFLGQENEDYKNISKNKKFCESTKKEEIWASLVEQWLRICLPMQGTRVRALVWEDPTCRRATRPVSHNYRACASGACAPQQERLR
ncbi:hypothetical protein J1605_000376 [Eschrichtius robustus]|uniref:Uncharacterized protein n=1 Tax=Eschrichtius robustus TaxID=9764 RepID=A0AB34HBJ8_ESCRO|nr:hypothetical protein J1605_000376 [Eschrichtius robustus]